MMTALILVAGLITLAETIDSSLVEVHLAADGRSEVVVHDGREEQRYDVRVEPDRARDLVAEALTPGFFGGNLNDVPWEASLRSEIHAYGATGQMRRRLLFDTDSGAVTRVRDALVEIRAQALAKPPTYDGPATPRPPLGGIAIHWTQPLRYAGPTILIVDPVAIAALRERLGQLERRADPEPRSPDDGPVFYVKVDDAGTHVDARDKGAHAWILQAIEARGLSSTLKMEPRDPR